MAAVYCILQSAIGHWRGVITRCLHFKAGCIITYDILCIAMDLVVCIYICICICLYLCAVFCAAADFSVNKDLYVNGCITTAGWVNCAMSPAKRRLSGPARTLMTSLG